MGATLVVVHRRLVPESPLVGGRGLYSPGLIVVAHGLVVLQHVGSSQTRNRTCVPCIGRWILIHCIHQGRPMGCLKMLFSELPILFI